MEATARNMIRSRVTCTAAEPTLLTLGALLQPVSVFP
jgi:hypothetical protein